MPRKKPRFHSLKKLNVRQDWSRWSLYSLSQLKAPNVVSRTYFQQKWTAKASTRAYHGEQLREKKWKRQFSRNLPAVVGMDHKYLARHDGSEQAAGRGAGADTQDKERTPPMTPYMQMAYYPLERRLDTAIFRALFASSVRQARQFVVHGLVKVNGKKMPYPGYMLNPGDMFQVEPSSVMFATGAQKSRSATARRVAKEKGAARAEAREQAGGQTPRQPQADVALAQSTREAPTPTELKKHLQELMEQVDQVLVEDVKAKDKQKFRAFRQSVRKAISLWRSANPETISTLDTQFDFLKTQIAERSAASTPSSKDTTVPEPLISEEDQARLRSAFEKLRLETEHTSAWNSRNAAAPYATPWRPRDYMSAFAFIPRYLEVNQNVCAAVYLRHPVARPGLAEVPTPFHIETGQLAFNWYLRNR
ncbi:alpha-L RNA-binding motif-containing protein [Cucurbitaria berberidis CBS 394.84]|uniref:Alpha-L RNA-binding motif-containing protein n=1 Tax=Cucurbitaria berberidis CBS 394.84 TaxID=1168544 RepID=A0A9P4GT21_9PLEO|nr:alpha-L RNA-binding motif-containing protein [Cucurbitaria berberidis CBS 394.84]KAF1850541.1 alpha-L RNA-binding motif-containing protein [Cucurbitaria berberidis CBS 394.84]